jgi:hypothetical protein
MSVKSRLARKAVKTTAKHTAHGTASKFTRRPFRSITLLALGAVAGGVVGWLIGRSGGGEGYPEPLAGTSGPTSVVTTPTEQSNSNNSTEQASETGAVP